MRGGKKRGNILLFVALGLLVVVVSGGPRRPSHRHQNLGPSSLVAVRAGSRTGQIGISTHTGAGLIIYLSTMVSGWGGWGGARERAGEEVGRQAGSPKQRRDHPLTHKPPRLPARHHPIHFPNPQPHLLTIITLVCTKGWKKQLRELSAARAEARGAAARTARRAGPPRGRGPGRGSGLGSSRGGRRP